MVRGLTGLQSRLYNAGSGNTRSDPVHRGRPDPLLSVGACPRNFSSWWQWSLLQADAAQDDPLRLHDRSRPPEPQSSSAHDGLGRRLTKRRDEAIVGQPFSIPFERRLGGKPPQSPMRDAMLTLWNPRGRGEQPQSQEFYVLFALSSGHTDPDIVCAVMGNPHRNLFEAMAIRAFEFVWQKAQEDLRRADPSAPPNVGGTLGQGI